MHPTDASCRPIGVMVFTSGPVLEPEVAQFLLRLEAHPDIDLLRIVRQAPGTGFRCQARSTWRRRRWLAVPLLGIDLAQRFGRWLRAPRAHRETARRLRGLAGRMETVSDMHAPEVLDRLRAADPDLGLAYGSPILKPALFEIPRQGTLGIHHGTVPAYRGKKTAFWAMYHGEPEAGVTIQKISSGLDTGAVVNADAVPTVGRSYRAVQRDLAALGVEIFVTSILQVRAGSAVYRPQSGPKGRLFRDPGAMDLVRFWFRRRRRRSTPALLAALLMGVSMNVPERGHEARPVEMPSATATAEAPA